MIGIATPAFPRVLRGHESARLWAAAQAKEDGGPAEHTGLVVAVINGSRTLPTWQSIMRAAVTLRRSLQHAMDVLAYVCQRTELSPACAYATASAGARASLPWVRTEPAGAHDRDPFDSLKETCMSLGTILLIVLLLMLVGAMPTWAHSRSWGYAPSGGLGLVVLVVLVLVAMGRL
jgi:Protein of unknown function (DUF3309)